MVGNSEIFFSLVWDGKFFNDFLNIWVLWLNVKIYIILRCGSNFWYRLFWCCWFKTERRILLYSILYELTQRRKRFHEFFFNQSFKNINNRSDFIILLHGAALGCCMFLALFITMRLWIMNYLKKKKRTRTAWISTLSTRSYQFLVRIIFLSSFNISESFSLLYESCSEEYLFFLISTLAKLRSISISLQIRFQT